MCVCVWGGEVSLALIDVVLAVHEAWEHCVWILVLWGGWILVSLWPFALLLW